jgi:hypothetical protein
VIAAFSDLISFISPPKLKFKHSSALENTLDALKTLLRAFVKTQAGSIERSRLCLR